MTNELVTRTVVVSHPHGLHLRPSLAIVNTVGKYQSRVEISNQRHAADARSIFDLLLLAAPQDTELVLTAAGPDADQAVSAVADLFTQDFASPPTVPPVSRPSGELRASESAGLVLGLP
jgi:phosphotransferase system HPr (HPr) family protein